jgi:hypothetical protein
MVQISKKQQILRESALFGLLHRIDEGLRSRTPFERFKKDIADGLLPGVELPDDKILGYLYDRAIEARADRAWVTAIPKIAKAESWKAHMHWLEDTTRLARKFLLSLETNDRLLPRADALQAKFVAHSVERFQCRLVEIHDVDRRTGQATKIKTNEGALRLARIGMDRTLRKNCPDLNGDRRADVIKLAVEAAGLKEEETTDAIIRQLSRVRRRKKKVDARVQPRSRAKRGTRLLRGKTRK